MGSLSGPEALAVIETASIARGFVVADAALKRAVVSVKHARAVTPGKFVFIFGGGVEATDEAMSAARATAGSNVIDELFLPGAHHALWPAIDGAIVPAAGDAIAIVETTGVAAAIAAADAALKAVAVSVAPLRLALGVGGKGWFTLAGALADVEAAADAVRATAKPDRLLALELIPQPHAELRGFLS
jgi:microcompartment protein CcmL/EutN